MRAFDFEGQMRGDLARARGQREMWRPELEQLIRLRASRDIEWGLYTKSIEYNQQMQMEKLRQQPEWERIAVKREENVAAETERQRKREDEAKNQETWAKMSLALKLPGMARTSGELMDMFNVTSKLEAAKTAEEKQVVFDEFKKKRMAADPTNADLLEPTQNVDELQKAETLILSRRSQTRLEGQAAILSMKAEAGETAQDFAMRKAARALAFQELGGKDMMPTEDELTARATEIMADLQGKAGAPAGQDTTTLTPPAAGQRWEDANPGRTTASPTPLAGKRQPGTPKEQELAKRAKAGDTLAQQWLDKQGIQW